MKLNTITFIYFVLKVLSLSWGKEDEFDFKLTVIVLTMNRPVSLSRLLRSLRDTDFENETDKFDVEIHVDKSVGLHYQECVE